MNKLHGQGLIFLSGVKKNRRGGNRGGVGNARMTLLSLMSAITSCISNIIKNDTTALDVYANIINHISNIFGGKEENSGGKIPGCPLCINP